MGILLVTDVLVIMPHLTRLHAVGGGWVGYKLDSALSNCLNDIIVFYLGLNQ